MRVKTKRVFYIKLSFVLKLNNVNLYFVDEDEEDIFSIVALGVYRILYNTNIFDYINSFNYYIIFILSNETLIQTNVYICNKIRMYIFAII